MSSNPPRFNFREAFSRRSMARELVGLTEFLIFGGALVWLVKSDHGQDFRVWLTVIAFTPQTGRYGNRAGFVRNEQLVKLAPVEAIVCQGSGLQSNLLQVLKTARIPTHAFPISGQAPAPTARNRQANG